MTQAVYQIKSIKTSRIYIGSTVNLDRRINEHISKLKLGKHDNPSLQSHFNKFGVDDLEFTVLKTCSDIKEMRFVELEEIKKIKEINPSILFNVIGVRWVGRNNNERFSCLDNIRKEIIFSLNEQGYTNADVSKIFGVNRSTVGRIINTRPFEWNPKHIKYLAT